MRGQIARTPEQLGEHLWTRRVDIVGECWVFRGARNECGYGLIRYGHKTWPAHRLSYTLANGPIPHGMDVLHQCDNRLCINPAHLWVGTHTDNMVDMQRKGRNRQPRGEEHNKAKLTEKQVREIRERYAKGGISQRVLGMDYDLTQGEVGKIVRGEMWGHID